MATCHLHPEVIKTPFSSLNKRPKKIPASSVTCISTGGSCLAVVAVRGDVWPTIRRHCSFQDSTNQPPRLYVLSKDLMHVVPRLTRHACAPPVKSLPSPLYQRTSRTTGIGESVMHTKDFTALYIQCHILGTYILYMLDRYVISFDKFVGLT